MTRSTAIRRASRARGGWQAFGGTWQAVDGAMQNISDDRGAKLMNGSTRWHNYIVGSGHSTISPKLEMRA